MLLNKLIDNLNLTPAANAPSCDINSLDITDITDDSRNCTPGCLFIARTGTLDKGEKYIRQAIDNGAAAVLCDSASTSPSPTVTIHPLGKQPIDNILLGKLAEQFFCHPSRKLKLIAVTGTNGKTTIAHITQQLLAAAGLRVGLIGTVTLDDGQNRTPATLTTPGAVEFSRLLNRMVLNHCHAVVAELSSHALDQNRAAALNFNVAVFSNLTQDHLDYHHTMDAYAAAKAKLFDQLPSAANAVINIDDKYAKKMLAAAKSANATITTCSLGLHPNAHCVAQVLQFQAQGCLATFDGPWGLTRLNLPMVGEHNVTNALLAAAAAQQITDLTKTIDHTLAHCKPVPGRLELLTTDHNTQPTILVDYAHTPDALENVLHALKRLTKGRLLVMFGCGGDRDRHKRATMGCIASKLADRVIVTSDNPRTENPQTIIDQIMQGIDQPQLPNVDIQPDRRKAIELVISKAKAGDIVLLAGKGHEDYQIIGKERVWFDDRVIAREVLGEE